MSIDFSVNTSGAQQQLRKDHAAHTALTGSFMGQQVKEVTTPFSLLANVAEEITFSADTTDDFELQERKEKESMQKSSKDLRKAYLEMMRQVNESEGLDDLRKALYQGKGKDGPLEEALKHFSAPSDLWAALAEILDEMEGDASAPKDVMVAIQAALTELEENHRPEILAGLHGAVQSGPFADVADSTVLRDFYRSTVCDYVDAFRARV